MATKTETDRTWQRWWLCQLEPYDVVAKLQSNQHHQHTNILYFHTPDALPVAQPTASKHWRHQQGKEQPSDTWTSRIRKSNHPGFCCSKRWWRWWWWQTELNDVQSSSQIKSTLKTIPTFGTSVGRMPFLLCNQWCQSTEGIDRTHSNPQSPHCSDTAMDHNPEPRLAQYLTDCGLQCRALAYDSKTSRSHLKSFLFGPSFCLWQRAYWLR